MLVLPGVAAAETWVVGVTGNIAPDVGCEVSSEECDLWEAIELANGNPGEDTIEFAVDEVEVTSPLPNIGEAVTIDGTGPGGNPGVEIWKATEGSFDGLAIFGSGSTIKGLAIGGFESGISLFGNENKVCNSYLGTYLDGETTEPNRIGVRVVFESSDNKIGSGCGDGNGNLISSNEWFGIVDEGADTVIRRNLIGTDATGTEPIPNGGSPAASEPGGGIYLRGEGATVGGTGAGQGNAIAFNEAPPTGPDTYFGGGIANREDNTARIRGNSIFANQGDGIFYITIPPNLPPEVVAVESTEAVSSIVSGNFSGGPSEAFEIDFYASGLCDPSGSGEGETYLGAIAATTDVGGSGEFEAALPVQPEGTFLTATATTEANGGTSEFSFCFAAPEPGPAPEPEPEPEPEPKPGPSPAPAFIPLAKVVPGNGESVAVAPKAGKVYVQRPGQKGKTLLKEGQTIPVGSIVDATKGKVTLTSVNAAGIEQTAVFYGGVFLVQQHEGSGLVILKLRGGNFRGCGKKANRTGKKSSARASGKSKSGRRLWGSGKGNFRTQGNHGSATVRGTIWFTEDRCNSTFFKVKRGVVSIRDFDAGKTFSLPAGKSYLAKP